MQQTVLNMLEAIKERDAGMQKAERTADSIDPAWREKAYKLLQEFLQINPGEFLVEDLRSYAAQKDFIAPASNRVWGPVIMKAVKEGLVVSNGYSRTRNPKAHSTPATVWMPVKQAS